MIQTRLSRNQEKKSKKQLIINLAGTIIILFLVVKFGIPLLVNFSLFLGGAKGGNVTTTNSTSPSFISAPVINPTFTATNSAAMTVSGVSVAKVTAQLYVNDALVDTMPTKDDGSFSFENVTLTPGNNDIKVKAKTGKTESAYSDPISVMYINKNPSLTVDSPSDGQSFSKDQNVATIKGKVDSDVKVTVNDFWAIVDANGNYSYDLHLQNGDNQIKVDAVDTAGNKTEKTLKVNYAQ